MTYKTVVALFENEESAPVVAQAAIDIGSIHNGHIIGLHGEAVDPLPIYSPFDVPDPTLMASIYEAAAKKRADLEGIFNKTVGASGIPNEWRVYRGTSGSTSTGMVETTRCADLVISGQPRAGFPSEFNDLLFESGRPILFIPWIARKFEGFNRVVIAWDGSREAARATFDSIPFLRVAKAVEIFSVDPQDTRNQSASMSGSDIAASLDRHGIKTTIATIASSGLATSAIIENHVSDVSADLLVMGAYSHSRFRETVFGGVTRTLLESMTVATLMSR
jgi:nucleotide-binding universal stress UspA family protein